MLLNNKKVNKKVNTNSVSQVTSSRDSKYGQIRHLSGASSEITFGGSNLSTVSTNLSGPHRGAIELRNISNYGTDIVISESANGSYVLYHHPDMHHQVMFIFYLQTSAKILVSWGHFYYVPDTN